MRYIIEGEKKSSYFESSKPWYLLGIVSFGSKRCGVGYPGIYTRCIFVYQPPLTISIYFVIIANPLEWSPSFPGFKRQ